MMDRRTHSFTMHNFRRLLTLRRAQKLYVWRRDRMTCQYCGARPPQRLLTLDHRLPLGRGGTDGAGNLAVACEACNHEKGQRTEEEYRSGRPLPRKLQ